MSLEVSVMSCKASLRVLCGLFVCLVCFISPATAQVWSNGYSYRSAITIDHTKVPNTDQTDFPVLISGTFASLATTANSGYVTNSNGYDIIFTSDAAGATVLPFEQEAYNPSTGAVIYWVQVPTVSHASDTTLYMFFGKSSVTTDQSNKNGVWDSNYGGVWHLPNGTTLNASDSTANGNNGTVSGAAAVSGKVGGAASFNGSGDYVDLGNGSSVQITGSALTLEAWINSSESNPSQWERIFVKEMPGDANPYIAYAINRVAGSNQVSFGVSTSSGGGGVNSSSSLSLGSWTHVVGTYDGAHANIYLNGVLDSQATQTGNIDSTSQHLVIGGDTAANQEYFNGKSDEVRISNVARTADWIATEYANQSSPSTFYTVGTATLGSSPYITGLSQNIGLTGTNVVISGLDFGSTQGSSTVTFNGTVATPSAWTATSITVPVPSSATSGPVVVTVSSTSSNSVEFAVTGEVWANGYAYRRSITLSHSQVSNSDQTNFPVLISGTFSDLANTINGGYVTSSNGYDIIFTSDASGSSLLPFERENYVASTGAIAYWVQVPTLSHTSDTTIYMFYSNGGVGSDPSSPASVWDSYYGGVWHLGSGSTLTATDSTSHGNAGSLQGATLPSATTGQIAGGASFDGSTSFIDIPGSSSLEPTSAITISGWTKFTTANANAKVFSVPYRSDSSWSSPYIAAVLDASSGTTGEPNLAFAVGGNLEISNNGAVVNDGQWHYLVGTYDGSYMRVYVDGAPSGSPMAQTGSIDYSGATNADASIGSRSKYNNSEFMDGALDEVRLSSIARSADWIATEYNNQKTPSAFFSTGTAQSGSVTPPSISGLSPDRKSTRLNSSHFQVSRMPSSA